MHHGDRRESGVLEREVAVAHRIQAVLAHRFEAQLPRHRIAVQRVARAGQCGRSQRQAVEPPSQVGQALGVACEHLHVGQQVVREAHRLRHLQVGVAGHHRLGVPLGHTQQRALHVGQQHGLGIDLAAQPQAHVGGHLVVA